MKIGFVDKIEYYQVTSSQY